MPGSGQPFRNMKPGAWQNLAVAGLLTFYLIQIALDVLWANTFGNLGMDFASYWSAGYIANHFGYLKVYDLPLMEAIQLPLLPEFSTTTSPHAAIPTPYLPVFLLPFQLLALMEPVTAYWLWTLINVTALLAYLRFFGLRVSGNSPSTRLVGLLMVASPVFVNMFIGQVNVWLVICIGEYVRAAISRKPLCAGLWLGGLLLKPQSLIVLVPALVLQRSFKTVAGLVAASCAIVGASLILGGLGSLNGLAGMWLGYAAGLPTNAPELMMNWRMIALHLGRISSPQVGWGVAVMGLVFTLLAALSLWVRKVEVGTPLFALALCGTLAATGAIAWHSHIHMAMLMIPPLFLLGLKHGELLGSRLDWWVFLPASLYCARLMLAATMRAGIVPGTYGILLEVLFGIGLFGLNIYFLGWAISEMRRAQVPARGSTGD
jgi:hypothetical protein